jgi:hypothetical protein
VSGQSGKPGWPFPFVVYYSPVTSPTKSIHPPLDLEWDTSLDNKPPEKPLDKSERDKLLDKLRAMDAYKKAKSV